MVEVLLVELNIHYTVWSTSPTVFALQHCRIVSNNRTSSVLLYSTTSSSTLEAMITRHWVVAAISAMAVLTAET